ncbi:MAG: A/G-specific adenine glycosylase [Verrucomicrobiota bacterium]
MRRIAKKLAAWYRINARDLPWRQTRDPYAVWISEIMLQQTQVKTVIPYFERWMRTLPTVEAFARAPLAKILKLWEGLGYYNRVRNAQAAARQIVRHHAGRFPEAFDDVLALPGVGRYTAGAICSIAFNQPAPVLDGNVIRVLSRLFGIAGDPRGKSVNTKLWNLARALVSLRGVEPSQLNQALMELGALICLPRRPKCALCPACRECFARRENRVGDFPAPARRTPARRRRFIAFIARRRGRIFVRRRPGGGVNAGLWEFPNIEIPVKTRNLASKAAPFSIGRGGPFFRVRHTITRSRILLEAFRANLPVSQEPPGAWKSMAEARQLAFTSAHRKVLEALCRLQTRKKDEG